VYYIRKKISSWGEPRIGGGQYRDKNRLASSLNRIKRSKFDVIEVAFRRRGRRPASYTALRQSGNYGKESRDAPIRGQEGPTLEKDR